VQKLLFKSKRNEKWKNRKGKIRTSVVEKIYIPMDIKLK
jgi:hypothetical protein